jgi:hypothetical protein
MASLAYDYLQHRCIRLVEPCSPLRDQESDDIHEILESYRARDQQHVAD